MIQQNVEISEKTKSWYAGNYRSARSGMSEALENIAHHLDKNPMAGMFSDTGQAHDFMLASWRAMWMHSLRTLKGVFTQHELCFLIEIHNGHMITPQMFGSNILPVAISDSIQFDGNLNQWEVTVDEFIEKAKALTPLQALCMEIWATGFWYGDQDEKDFYKYADQLI